MLRNSYTLKRKYAERKKILRYIKGFKINFILKDFKNMLNSMLKNIWRNAHEIHYQDIKILSQILKRDSVKLSSYAFLM